MVSGPVTTTLCPSVSLPKMQAGFLCCSLKISISCVSSTVLVEVLQTGETAPLWVVVAAECQSACVVRNDTAARHVCSGEAVCRLENKLDLYQHQVQREVIRQATLAPQRKGE